MAATPDHLIIVQKAVQCKVASRRHAVFCDNDQVYNSLFVPCRCCPAGCPQSATCSSLRTLSMRRCVFAILSRLREHGRFQKVRAAVKAHMAELLATPDLMARYPC